MKSTNPMSLVFDFDGTIADTHSLAVSTLNSLSFKYGFETLECSWSRDYPMDVLMKKIGIARYHRFFLARDMKRIMLQNTSKIKPFHHLRCVLEKLCQQNYRMGIMTSNSHQLVQSFLKNHDMDCFDFIYSNTGLFGKHKAIKKLIKDHKIRRLAYVGDEVRDVLAMKKADVPMIAVSWGWNSKELLLKFNPNYLVDNPQDILDIASMV